MCKWNKWGDTRIDPCMKNLIVFLQHNGIETLACCCGHGKYPMTIIIKYFSGNTVWEVMSKILIPRKKRFYKKDKQGYYYIPEVLDGQKK